MSRMLRTIWPSLHRMCYSTQNSRSRAHQTGAAVSFQTPFGRAANHHSSDSPDMLEQIEPRASFAPRLVNVLVSFLRRVSHCVERVWHNWAESSFKCFCVSSWQSRSVLKKLASVVAEDSALMVTVFACSSSASVFPCVSLMASLYPGSASVASWTFFACIAAFSLPATHAHGWLPPWPHGRHCPVSLMRLAR